MEALEHFLPRQIANAFWNAIAAQRHLLSVKRAL
jgi:hypothetical protein